jgi:hypothetical protein
MAEGEVPCPYVQKKLFSKLSNAPLRSSSDIYDFTSPLSVLLKGAVIRSVKLKNAKKDHVVYLVVRWKKSIVGSESGDTFTGEMKKGEDFQIPFFEDLDIRKEYKDVRIEYTQQDFDGLEMTIDIRDLSCA